MADFTDDKELNFFEIVKEEALRKYQEKERIERRERIPQTDEDIETLLPTDQAVLETV